MLQVHTAEAFDSGLVAMRAGCGGVEVPEVGEDAASLECEAVGDGGFEGGEAGEGEVAGGFEGFHCSVAGAGGDEGGCGGAAVEGEVE